MRKKIAYVNYTGIQSHIGCLAVSDTHLRSLMRHGYEVSFVSSYLESRFLWRGNRKTSLEAFFANDISKQIESCDAVFINGEGTP